jgi:hypothetical protein
MKSAALALMLVAFLGFSDQEGTGRIRGKVEDASTGQLLQKCNIFVYSDNSSIPPRGINSHSGGFIMLGVPAGGYHVYVSREGYRSFVTKTIEVKAGKVAEVAFLLHPAGGRADGTDAVDLGEPGVDYKMQYFNPEGGTP